MPSTDANIPVKLISTVMTGVSFSDQVRIEARGLGFDAVGIARASHSGLALDRDYDRYTAFVAAGMQGEMDFLERNCAVRERLDTAGILEGARSVVCVARRYGHVGAKRGDKRAEGPSGEGPSCDASSEAELPEATARYARGRDYHRFLRRRLRRLATFIRSLGTAEHPVRARPICDEEPVLERAWAVRAGLGFVGKNGMLIVPGLGSMVLLGEVVTTLDLTAAPSRAARDATAADQPMAERCGSCTRCLDACPTQAFVSPFVLDPRRCVSYLTIEHRGPIPIALREGVGGHLFGCDDCQTVCPFNAGGATRARLDPSQRDPFAALERWAGVRLESILSLDEPSFRALFSGTAMRRPGRVGMARNAAVVLGNRNDAGALASLRAAAAGHDHPTVREAAAWAVARIERGMSSEGP
jgi:epoxyqueuosine reductase